MKTMDYFHYGLCVSLHLNHSVAVKLFKRICVYIFPKVQQMPDNHVTATRFLNKLTVTSYLIVSDCETSVCIIFTLEVNTSEKYDY